MTFLGFVLRCVIVALALLIVWFMGRWVHGLADRNLWLFAVLVVMYLLQAVFPYIRGVGSRAVVEDA